MKYLIVFLLAESLNRATAQLPEPQVNKIANAIYKLEGGANTRYLYGIKSVRTTNPRQVCINTINNTHKRWITAGKPDDFLNYLANRYCPPADDPIGNRNWRKNIHKLVDKS